MSLISDFVTVLMLCHMLLSLMMQGKKQFMNANCFSEYFKDVITVDVCNKLI